MSAWYRIHLGGLETQRSCGFPGRLLVRQDPSLRASSADRGRRGCTARPRERGAWSPRRDSGRNQRVAEERSVVEGTAQHRSGADRSLAFARRRIGPHEHSATPR